MFPLPKGEVHAGRCTAPQHADEVTPCGCALLFAERLAAAQLLPTHPEA
jgi:hypothetical protein